MPFSPVRLLSRSIALVSLIALAGCASMSNVDLDPAARDRIERAFVSSKVTVPENVFYQGPAQSIGMGVGGLVGFAIAASADGKKITMQELIRGLPMREIVRDAFRDELRASGAVPLTNQAEEMDVEFSFEVEIYGLGQTQGFATTLYPNLGFHAILTNPAGEVLWRRYAAVSPLNGENDIGYKSAEFAAKPQLLRDAFENASAVVSRKLIEDLLE